MHLLLDHYQWIDDFFPIFAFLFRRNVFGHLPHKFLERSSDLLTILHNGHVLLDKTLLGLPHISCHVFLPRFDAHFCIDRIHQLRLHRKILHMLLFESFDQLFDASLAIFRVDKLLQFASKQIFKCLLLFTSTKRSLDSFENSYRL